MDCLRVLACALCVCTWAACARGDDVVVNTRYGALRGSRTDTGPTSHVDVFYNIPYAKPPVGPLRFKKPQEFGSWTGTRDATQQGPACPQVPDWLDADVTADVMGQEDCLFLNVYTPQVAASSGPLPVMVWIHGGGYVEGRATTYDGRWMAGKGVVVVTINYRLGALGFLSTEDGVVVGNYGLWDQVRALQWVKAAISAFKGDPNDVTIFGESAGSSSVSLLTLSPKARGLFSKAIMESGTSLSPWASRPPGTNPSARSLSLLLGEHLGCDVSDSNKLTACLMGKTADQIVKAGGRLGEGAGAGLAFAPVFETTFGQVGLFAATPEVILRHGWFNNVTVIRGFNRDEVLSSMAALDPEDDGFTMKEFLNLTRGGLAPLVHDRYPLVAADRIADLIVQNYVTKPGLTDPRDLRHALGLANTDFYFISPTFLEQRLWQVGRGATEYVYCVTYRSANRKTPAWAGVSHTDEIPFVFGETNNPNGLWAKYQQNGQGWTEDDKRFADIMMTMWTDFAKYGNPTPAGSKYPTWVPSTPAAKNFLDVKLVPEMEEVPAARAPSILLWSDVIPSLHQAAAAALVG